MSQPTVVNLDMARSTSINQTSAAVKQLVNECAQSVGGYVAGNFGGDGATLVFTSPLQAHAFAEILHKRSYADHNITARKDTDFWCFRMGLSAGSLSVSSSGEWSGSAFAIAARLQTACGTGEIFIDDSAFRSLPLSHRSCFGPMEPVPGKRHEESFETYRRRVVMPAPWDEQWGSNIPVDWQRELRIAIGAVETIRPRLDSLFRQGTPVEMAATHEVRVLENPQVVSSLGIELAHIVREHLTRSTYKLTLDALDPKTTKALGASQDDYFWAVDVLDGSRHILRGIPFYSTTLALLRRTTGEAVLGVTYLPWTQERFFAIEGGGAFRNDWNGSPLRISTPDMDEAAVYVEFPHRKGNVRVDDDCRVLAEILKRFKRARGMALGSFGLAYVAKGAFDAYVDFSYTSRIHNMAAGCLLVREAGGTVLTLANGLSDQFHRCIAGTKEAVEVVRPILHNPQ